jgi:hypothetical protein
MDIPVLVEPRGTLLPTQDWTVEIQADGTAVVCATIFERRRQHYRVRSVKFTEHITGGER